MDTSFFKYNMPNKEIIDGLIIEKLKDSFFGVYAADLDTGAVRILKNSPWYSAAKEGDIMNYTPMLRAFAATQEGEAKAFFEQMSDIDYARSLLTGEEKVTYAYQSKFVAGNKWVNVAFVVINRNADGTPSLIVVAFNELDTFSSEREELRHSLNATIERQKIQMEMIDGLASEYTALYHIDLDKGTFTNYSISDRISDTKENLKKYTLGNDVYNAFVASDAVYPEDKEKLLALRPTSEAIREILAHRKKWDVVFRRKYGDEYLWTQMTYIKFEDTDEVPHNAVLGFIEKDREIRERLERERQEQKKNDDLISTFANEYEASFLCRLDTDSYTILSEKGRVVKGKQQANYFAEALPHYVATFVHPSYRELFSRDCSSAAAVAEKLGVGASRSLEYRSNTHGEYSWRRMEMHRVSEDTVLVGFKECDEEVLSRLVEKKLLGKYDALYFADLNEDVIRPVYYTGRASVVGSFTQVKRYSEVIKQLAALVEPKYTQDWLNFSKADYMREYMAEEDQREYIYELPGMEKQFMRRCTIDVLDRAGGKPVTLLLAFEGIDDIRAQAIRLQQKMAESGRIIGALSDDFFSVDYVELHTDKKDDTIVNYRMSDLLARYIPGWNEELNFSRRLDLLINNLIYEPDRKQVYADTRREKILAKLEEANLYYINTRLFIDNEIRYYQMKLSAVRENGEMKGFVFGLHSVDEQTRNEQKHHNELVQALAEATLANHRNDLLYDIVNGGKWVYDISAEGEVVAARYSDKAQDISDTEIVGTPMGWLEHLYPEDRERIAAEFKAAISDRSGNTPYDTTFRVLGKEGNFRWVKSAGRMISHEDGTGELFGMTLDITEQMEEEQKRLSEKNEIERLRMKELELKHSEFRASSLAYLVEHEGDITSFLNFFAEKLRELVKCDQVIYRDENGNRYIHNAPELGDGYEIAGETCLHCPHSDMHAPLYAPGVTEMEDTAIGVDGIPVHKDCPVKSALTRIVYLDGKVTGYLAIHYILDYHRFSDYERKTLEEFTNLLSLSLSRYAARTKNALLEKELQLQQQIAEQKEQLEIQQKQLAAALAMAESANNAKTSFLFNMSHDIRTPMNAILGFTQLVEKNLDDRQKVADYTGKIEQAGNHLLGLINDVLEMSRIESGKITLDEEPTDIRQSGEMLRAMLQNLATEKKLDFSVEVDAIKHEYLYVDMLRANQVLINIISNAIKYTPEGGRVRCTIEHMDSLKPGYTKARFTVADNGIGMSEEFVKKIFEPFSREKSSTLSGVQGTGLGMSIVKKIVDLMGGTITVQSELGKGTTVVVEADFRIADKVEAKTVEKTDVDFTGKKVLLVEDNELNREIAVAILEESKFIVDTAEDGDIAVEKMKNAQTGDYDIVLMDIQMPRMDGYEATKHIRDFGTEISKLPIIAMTANAFEEDRRAALEAGMDDHIAKPINVEKLKETLAKFL